MKEKCHRLLQVKEDKALRASIRLSFVWWHEKPHNPAYILILASISASTSKMPRLQQFCTGKSNIQLFCVPNISMNCDKALECNIIQQNNSGNHSIRKYTTGDKSLCYVRQWAHQGKSFLYVFLYRPKAIGRQSGRYKNVLQHSVIDLNRISKIK